MSATRSRTPVVLMTSAPNSATRRRSTGATTSVDPPGIGSMSESWPMSCRSAAYSSSSRSFSVRPSSRPIAIDELADPVRVTFLDVAADLGDPRERTDGLAVGRADRCVPAERELGQQQRNAEHRQRVKLHGRRRKCRQHTGRPDCDGKGGGCADLVAQASSRRLRPGPAPARTRRSRSRAPSPARRWRPSGRRPNAVGT